MIEVNITEADLLKMKKEAEARRDKFKDAEVTLREVDNNIKVISDDLKVLGINPETADDDLKVKAESINEKAALIRQQLA